MEIFGNTTNSRGCFAVFRANSSEGRGYQLVLPSGNMPLGAYSDPLLVVGVNTAQQESRSVAKCFNDVNFLYSFGHNPDASSLTVSFIGMLITQDGTGRTGITEEFLAAYKSARIWENRRPVQLVTVDGAVMEGFVDAMGSQPQDPHFNLMGFSMRLTLLEAQGGV